MTEKFIDLADEIQDEQTWLFTADTHRVLQWLDDHPERLPGRTITRKRLEEKLAVGLKLQVDQVIATLERLGITVVMPPTNKELLAAAIEEFTAMPIWELESLADGLDRRGVKAPEVDDE